MKNEFLSTYVANNLRACQLNATLHIRRNGPYLPKAPPDLLAGRSTLLGAVRHGGFILGMMI